MSDQLQEIISSEMKRMRETIHATPEIRALAEIIGKRMVELISTDEIITGAMLALPGNLPGLRALVLALAINMAAFQAAVTNGERESII